MTVQLDAGSPDRADPGRLAAPVTGPRRRSDPGTGSPSGLGWLAQPSKMVTWPDGLSHAAMLCVGFTLRPKPLGTGSWNVPSVSWISMYGVPLVGGLPDPRAVLHLHELVGVVAGVHLAAPPSAEVQRAVVDVVHGGAAPVGRSDTSSTPGAGCCPSAVVCEGSGWGDAVRRSGPARASRRCAWRALPSARSGPRPRRHRRPRSPHAGAGSSGPGPARRPGRAGCRPSRRRGRAARATAGPSGRRSGS